MKCHNQNCGSTFGVETDMNGKYPIAIILPKIPQQLAMGGVTKVGANCINCMLAFKERLPLALPGFCGKKGGKLFEARWLQSNFCTFVPSNFLQSAFLTITLSTVYEACGNVQLISRKTEQSNSGGAKKRSRADDLLDFTSGFSFCLF